MKAFVRGVAAILTTTVLVAAAAFPALAQDKAALDSERARVSYMVGHDVARSVAPAAPDIDLAAFERAVRNALEGGEPLVEESQVESVGRGLMMRIASRAGQAPAGAEIPEVDKQQVGYLVGSDVGRSLEPMKAELDLAVLMQGVRATFAGGELAMSEAELGSTREAFGQKMRGQFQARMQAEAEANKTEGAAFLAANRQEKGVFTTPSGLQYRVLRQGSGMRPRATDRVRVNYEGSLLDGTVFDSSYERGQPAEFGLDQVIAGWTEGLTMMPVGAKYRFWIPGELGYGAKGGGGGQIGPNATLVFDVELQAIVE
ncbi:FKBP-type peptidyl-prolyl cis-trans isomerase N-terminal domain-containing protein [Lysobacter sp. F60174L2]|uniref:FKBP-type peptidyl-prolyl cis-trans isomerase N-terminal domain-containing protein n=1 Tax=Lysobacter sp. F60174L2 TaxID=3459295 RepID=UPI00403D85BD